MASEMLGLLLIAQ